MRLRKIKDLSQPETADATKRVRANFQRIERREWWLWGAAFVITLALTLGLVSFLLPHTQIHQDFFTQSIFSQAIRGLVALVFLFDLYTIYQHILIHRIRKQLVEREALFHLISENAADMIAVVDMEGNESITASRINGCWAIHLRNCRPLRRSSRFTPRIASA